MAKRSHIRSRKGAPGIVDVAQRANVSPATVSRFFNTPEMLRGPTRKRIEIAAKDLGYIRDRMAGALNNRFSGTFGLIVPTIDNAIFSELIEAFSACLQKHDRTMLIASHGYDLGLETGIVRSLLERRIDGIALIGFDHDTIAMNMLEQRDVPVISVWNYRADEKLPCVGSDNGSAAQLVVDHLLDLGHSKIAVLFPDTNGNDRARRRLEVTREILQKANHMPPPQWELQCPYDVGAAKQMAIEFLSQHRPTAILCGNDIIAHGVMYACQHLGLDVPGEISVAGIGDFGGSEHLEPGLTTVRLPARRIGTQAAETLLQMSETGILPKPYHQSIAPALKVRGSTGPLD